MGAIVNGGVRAALDNSADENPATPEAQQLHRKRREAAARQAAQEASVRRSRGADAEAV